MHEHTVSDTVPMQYANFEKVCMHCRGAFSPD